MTKTIKDRIDEAYKGFRKRPFEEDFYDFYIYQVLDCVRSPQKFGYYLKYWNTLKKEKEK